VWQGNRIDFGAAEFQCRCDGRPNNLTLIRDTDSLAFGSFTPVECESREWN
jgi:hypothetical protein